MTTAAPMPETALFMRLWLVRIHRWILLGILACTPAAAWAQPIRVQAGLSDARVLVGDSVVYQIVIEGETRVEPPDITAPPGLSIEFAGATHQPAPVYIINGARQDTGPDKYILNYRVTPSRPGDFTIPAHSVRIAGQDYPLPAARLIATEPPEDTSSILEASLSKSTAYVGEPVTLTLNWLFSSEVRGVSFSTLGGPVGYESLPAQDPRPSSGRVDQRRFPTLSIDGQEVVCELGSTIRGGREYAVVTLRRTLIPSRAGELTIGPFAATAQVKVGEREIGLLLTEDVLERRISRSEPIALNVRPLPTQGRPPSFSGLVGRFSIDAAASPTRASVGDPIDLRIVISGPEPLARVEAPDLAAMPGFADEFRLSPEGFRLESSQQAGSRSFTTTIRATSDRVDEVPPIQLWYFDTELEEYTLASSDPIPLTIAPTRQVTAADAVGPGRSADPVAPGHSARSGESGVAILSPGPGGLLANTTSPAALRDDSGDLRTLLTHPAYAAGLLIPPAAFAAAGVYTLARRRAPTPASRRREALRRALPMLRSRRADVSAAIRTFIATSFDLPVHAVTAYDVRRLLSAKATAGAASDPAEQLAAKLDHADAARLAGSPPPPPSEVAALLRAIAKGGTP